MQFPHPQKHKEWLKRRTADKISAGYVETDDPYQKIKYFKKLIKFKNQNDAASANEISFVPHLSGDTKTKDAIDGANSRTRAINDDELTTVIIDTGNKFAYDTINNNEDSEFAGNNVSISGMEKSNNGIRTTQTPNEVVEQSSPDTSENIVKVKNEQQESAVDVSNNVIKSQMEVSSTEAPIGESSHGDAESNRPIVATSMDSKNEISASVANNTSTEKSSNDFEIQRFISEHIKYKSNNITIKKSWSKWTAWSGCSRSCGEGVMAQSRECTEKM